MISVVVLVVSFTYVALGVYVRHIGQPSASRPMITPCAAARPALPKMRRAVDPPHAESSSPSAAERWSQNPAANMRRHARLLGDGDPTELAHARGSVAVCAHDREQLRLSLVRANPRAPHDYTLSSRPRAVSSSSFTCSIISGLAIANSSSPLPAARMA